MRRERVSDDLKSVVSRPCGFISSLIEHTVFILKHIIHVASPKTLCFAAPLQKVLTLGDLCHFDITRSISFIYFHL